MAEIGARLRDARLRAGIDINEVELRTKIRAKYLRAMENEEWDLLPGDVYVRSFLRSYGAFLDLDTRSLIDEFRRGYETPADHEPPPIVPPSRQSDRRSRGRGGGGGVRVAPWVVTGLVLVVVVVVLVIIGLHNGSTHDATPQTARARVTHQHLHPGHGRRSRRRSAPPKPTHVRLALTASGPTEVYVCLENGAGKRLIAGQLFAPGDPIPVETASRLLLTLGNASIRIKANGVPVPVSASAGAIGLEFTPGHHTTLPADRQPSCS